MAKYINPYTDLDGSPLRFKKLFGEEGNKDLLIDFLNQLLPTHHQIADLNFRNVENLADLSAERKAIQQRDSYEQSLIQYRDLKSALETAVEEREIEIARKAINKGFDNQTIADLTDLTTEQIEQLRKEIKKN